jgi:sorbitol-specific phosphotransferase system component IIC
MKKSIIHACLGLLAILLISIFWISTFISEVFLNQESIIFIKKLIVNYGLIPLILIMILTGATGNFLSKKNHPLLETKKKRMPYIALNGIFIMVPSALFLNFKASNDEFDLLFYSIQVFELLVGIVQLTLLFKNFLDGLSLTKQKGNVY